MDHDEINMVRDRSLGPYLQLTFGLNDRWADQLTRWDLPDANAGEIEIHVGIRNVANEVAESALIDLGIHAPPASHSYDNIYRGQFPAEMFPSEFTGIVTRHVQCLDEDDSYLSHNSPLVALSSLSWNGTNQALSGIYAPLFKTADPWPVAKLSIGTPSRSKIPGPYGYWFWRVQAPGMQPKLGVETLSLGCDGSLFLENKGIPWEFTSR